MDGQLRYFSFDSLRRMVKYNRVPTDLINQRIKFADLKVLFNSNLIRVAESWHGRT